MMIAESFSTAILFPLAAMRPSLVAEPFIEVVMVENVSDYQGALAISFSTRKSGQRE